MLVLFKSVQLSHKAEVTFQPDTQSLYSTCEGTLTCSCSRSYHLFMDCLYFQVSGFKVSAFQGVIEIVLAPDTLISVKDEKEACGSSVHIDLGVIVAQPLETVVFCALGVPLGALVPCGFAHFAVAGKLCARSRLFAFEAGCASKC